MVRTIADWPDRSGEFTWSIKRKGSSVNIQRCTRTFSARLPVGLVISLLCALISLSVCKASDNEPKRAPHVVFVLTDPAAPEGAALSQCERLTIQGYRDRGVKVTEVSYTEMDRWREGEGKEHTKAHPYFQSIAFAKSRGADAIGGLTSWHVTPEDLPNGEIGSPPSPPEQAIGGEPKPAQELAKRIPDGELTQLTAALMEAGAIEAGTYFHSWGLSLSGAAHNFVRRLDGKCEVRALPLHLVEQGDPWSVPLTIDPKPCGSMGPAAIHYNMPRGRPFIGVRLEGNVLIAVLPKSPAEAAGLRVGDTLLSVHGRAVSASSDISEALKGLSPGTEVELEYRRDGAAMKKQIKLADLSDAVEVQQSLEGKLLPDFTGLDINGRDVRLRDFKGKIVLMDFWATWCGPCLEELPLLQLLWEKAKNRDFVWISVSVDEDKEAWETFVRNNGLGGIQLRNPQWAANLSIHSYPTVLLVDRSGTFRCDLRGDSIAQAVMAMLAEKP